MKQSTALQLINEEATEASKRFPAFNSTHEGFGVLLEEVDKLWDEVKNKHAKSEDLEKEAIQVGAMAVRFLTDLIPDNNCVQSLKVAHDLMGRIRHGVKRATTRRGYRDFRPGEMMLLNTSDYDDVYMVMVKNVQYMLSGDLTDSIAQMEGYETASELKEAIRRHYPDFDSVHEQITVISW